MTARNDSDETMDEFADLWRTQEAGRPDFARLQREAGTARRRGIALTVFEVAAFVLAVCVGASFVGERGWGLAAYVVTASLALAAAFSAWTIWNRRAQLRRTALAPAALVESEVQRVHAARRFWRANTRVMLVLLASVALLALAQGMGWLEGTSRARWWMTAFFNLPLVVISIAWARRRDASLRRRLETLEALRRQLAD